MDPDRALNAIRECLLNASKVIDNNDDAFDWSACPLDLVQLSRVVDLFTGLDEWLTRGGFLPSDWQGERHA